MQNLLTFSSILATAILMSCTSNSSDGTTPDDEVITPEGFSLVWQDEFDGIAINTANWGFETGDGTDFGLPAGWGNNELQLYTNSDENVQITEDGEISVLKITAMEDGSDGYTSSKIVTKDKFSMRFGQLEVRAKLPQGQGVWPAIWMLGTNNDEIDWPGCGEIDLLELLGHEPSKVYSTLHFVNGESKKGEEQGSYELQSGSFSDDYHVFSLDWTPEQMTFYVDDTQFHQVAIEEDMKEFLRSFYLIANVAVGGYWPGNPDNSTQFPQSMMIDYVRVFEKDDFEAPDAPALDIDEETMGQNIEPSLALNAIKDGFTDLGNISIVSYGGGGEPVVAASTTAIDGAESLSLEYAGGAWGGAYMELESGVDLSSYSQLKFAISKPENLVDAEIKLESPTSNAAVFLVNYTATPLSDGFVEYTIPLSDFSGLDLTGIHIPFSLWNPLDDGEAFVAGEVLLDNLHFTD